MRIRWTSTAARDLTSISDYVLKEKSSAAARRVALAIYERVDSLKQFPRAGRPGRKAQTRELIITGLPYLVVYRSGPNSNVNLCNVSITCVAK